MIGSVVLLLGFTALSVWFCIVVIHGWRTKVMWARGGNVSKTDRPIAYWISIAIALSALCFSLVMTAVMFAGITKGW